MSGNGMLKDGRYASNSESGCEKKPKLSRRSHAWSAICARNLNMKHEVYFSTDVLKAILCVKQSVLLSNYRNTRGSLRELERAVETLACRPLFPQHFSFSDFFNSIETRCCLTEFLVTIILSIKGSFLICLSVSDAEWSRKEKAPW